MILILSACIGVMLVSVIFKDEACRSAFLKKAEAIGQRWAGMTALPSWKMEGGKRITTDFQLPQIKKIEAEMDFAKNGDTRLRGSVEQTLIDVQFGGEASADRVIAALVLVHGGELKIG